MILLRHGQSEFNLHFTQTRVDPGIEDPRLTPLGHAQAEAAAAALAGLGLKRLVASPYTRALQTAAPIGRALGLPVLVWPEVRERYAFVCDVGSPGAALAAAWPALDFAGLEERWWPGAEEVEAALAARADRFRDRMRADPAAADTLVVTHWGFIRALTGQSVGNGEWLRCPP